MEIYLMQHGEALPEEENPERPLSGRGVDQVRTAAAALKRLGVAPQLLLCSPKRRSRQSAALIAETVNYPYSDIFRTEAVKAGAPAAETLDLLAQHRQSESVLIAGHLPNLANLAALLLGGEAPVRLRFENGGLCRIDSGELAPGSGELVFHLPPSVLQVL